MTSRPARRPTRRGALALAVAVTVAAGLLVRSLGAGAPSEVAGDALYAALVYLLAALVAPSVRPARLAVVAWALCAVVELAQLVGLASAIVDLWEPARWVLGTTFHAPDLVVYAVGAAGAALVDAAGRAATLRLSAGGATAASASPSVRRDLPPTRDRPSSRS